MCFGRFAPPLDFDGGSRRPVRRRSPGADDGGGAMEEEEFEEEWALMSSGGAREWPLDGEPFKLVLVVNQELKMGKGKASASFSMRLN